MSNRKSEGSSLKVKTFLGMIWSFLDLILNQVISFLVQLILARLLFPEDFGTIAIISVFIGIAMTLIDSGFSNALIREKNVNKEDYSTIFNFNVVMAILMYCILFISAPAISSFFNDNRLILMIRIVSIGILFYSLELTQRAMLIKKIDFKTQTKASIIASTLSGVIAIILALNNYGVWSLIIKILSMYIIQAITLCIFNRWKPSFIFDFNSFKRLFRFGWRLLISGLIDTIYNNIYYLIIGKKFSGADLGYYTNAVKLSEPAYVIITKAVEKVSFPVLSKINDDTTIRNAYKMIFKNIAFISMPVLLGLCAIAKPLIIVILGSKWSESIVYFQILCISGIGLPLGVINLNVLQVKGRTDLFLRLELIKKTILTIIIFIVLICRLGIMGLLWGLLINSIIGYFINSYFSKSFIEYSTFEQLRDIKNTAIISIIMAIVVYVIGVILPFSNLIKILVQVSIGITIYFVGNKLIKSEELNTLFKLLSLLVKSNCSNK